MIGDKSALLTIAQAMAEHATIKQATVSENLAQLNTPGYRAREVAEFSEVFVNGESSDAVVDVTAPIKPNGNSVSLESQLMEMAQAKGQHDMALGLWEKTMMMFNDALGRR